ncbi:MAG: TonB-dependent receptor [Gammaproteobacteria bacterium]|nr:TonB-dependent receptor [Gammaproteobacteria bacterium]
MRKKNTDRQNRLTVTLSWALFSSMTVSVAAETETGADISAVPPPMQELVVWGEQKESAQAGYTSPVSTLKQEDLKSINMATTEDAVKYEPSIVIRRRFIGDSNGTLGLRGSNMFQTSRSMVFADGVPLHYLLQSRWNGAPRWTMVSSSEIAQVDVVYGPFSAEYGGNAMGGVVLIETKIPQQQQFHFDGMLFSQSFQDYGFDDSVNGYKGFMSYGNKIGELSLYMSFNHLDNESQPQIFRDSAIDPVGTSTTSVTGGIAGNNSTGNARIFYGDTGVVDTITDNYKIKLGYDFNNWSALLNLAYEDRNASNIGNSYVQDSLGNTVWSGAVDQAGTVYTINGSRIGATESERNSLNVGLRLKAELADTIQMEINLSAFDVSKDETRSSLLNPNDTLSTGAGKITDFGDTGWQTAEAKWMFDDLGIDGLSMIAGLRQESYKLNINVYDSANYAAGTKDTLRDSSGGETSLAAVFSQFNWELNELWDTSFGLRYESWNSDNGYYDQDGSAVTDLVYTPSRSEEQVSPKFSLGHKPAEDWIVRYSLAKAYRFPIVEELYSQYEAYASQSLANPDLKSENGLHHNIMVEHGLKDGYLRVNLYSENIEDVIESQTDTSGPVDVRTFVPVDEVKTTGLEFIANLRKVMTDELDIRFNLAYTDSKIVRNAADPAIVGNRFPRMPEWRGNLLATWHISTVWDLSGSLQYASNSYARLDNTDEEDNVYGAQDSYTRLGMKTTYRLNTKSSFSFGIDNLSDEVAYVAHPWPGRTIYATASFDI